MKAVKGCAGYGTICSPSAQFVNVGSSHYLQLHLQHAAAAVSLKFLSRKFLISVSPIGIVQLSSPPAGWGRGGEISFRPRAMEIFIENYYGIVYWRGALSGQSYA